MKLTLGLAYYALGIYTIKDLPGLAVDALVDGLDTDWYGISSVGKIRYRIGTKPLIINHLESKAEKL